MVNVHIEKGFLKEEVSKLAQLEDECFEPRFRTPSDLFLESLYEGDVWVAKGETQIIHTTPFDRQHITSQEQIVGFIVVTPIEDGSETPYVYNLAVQDAYRGHGVATALLDEVHSYFQKQGRTKISLHVAVENPAQKLYFDKGYRIDSIDKNFYGDELDALLMYKRL